MWTIGRRLAVLALVAGLRFPLEAQALRREQLTLGTLFLPAALRLEAPQTLVVFFHGADAPEAAAQENTVAVLSVYFPTNSDPYVATFAPLRSFDKLLREAEDRARVKFGRFIFGCFSAGCGAVRVILKDQAIYDRTSAVFAMDGIYADYVARSKPSLDQLEIWLRLARDSIAGRKQFLVTHTDVDTDDYASAKRTADWLLEQTGLRRTAVRAGRDAPRTEAAAGGFLLKGFPGNEPVNHLGQLALVSRMLQLVR